MYPSLFPKPVKLFSMTIKTLKFSKKIHIKGKAVENPYRIAASFRLTNFNGRANARIQKCFIGLIILITFVCGMGLFSNTFAQGSIGKILLQQICRSMHTLPKRFPDINLSGVGQGKAKNSQL